MSKLPRRRNNTKGQPEPIDFVAEIAQLEEIGPKPATKEQMRYVNHSQLLKIKPEFEQEYPVLFGETWAEFVERLQPFPDDYEAGLREHAARLDWIFEQLESD